MVDSTYPEIKKIKDKYVTASYLLNFYSSSNLPTRINLIRKYVLSQAPEEHTIPFWQEMYKGTYFL